MYWVYYNSHTYGYEYKMEKGYPNGNDIWYAYMCGEPLTSSNDKGLLITR